MGASEHLHSALHFDSSRASRAIWRRLGIASLVVLALHLIFFGFIAPHLELDRGHETPTEVVQISQQELSRLKEQMKRKQELAPLLKDEVHERFRSKEAPKDADMMAPFNQVVPKQQIAGAQRDAPQQGGGNAGAKTSTPEKKLDLAKLGLGSKVAPPPKPEQSEATGAAGPQGPPGTFRPVGREDKNIEKGEQNLLNAVESAYYSFFVRLEDPIVRNWFFLLKNHDGQLRQEMAARKLNVGSSVLVVIEFAIDRNGNFVKLDVAQSSGVPIFDWLTREAIKKLGSIPNPPPGLFENQQYFTRQMGFEVHLTGGPMMESRPDFSW